MGGRNKKCWKPVNNYFRRHGNAYLVGLTALEILFYIAYTVVYCLRASEEQTGIPSLQIFKWFLSAVLLIS